MEKTALLMDNHDLRPFYETSNVPVVISASNFYSPYAGVFIRSLILHASKDKNYDIIIFEREISNENKRLLKSLEQGHPNISIRFLSLRTLFEHVDLKIMESHFPLEAYCGLLTPYLLKGFTKILAIDVDTMLRKDAAELLSEDLGDCCIGGVQEIMLEGAYRSNTSYNIANGTRMQDYFRETVRMKNPLKYINSGVLILDCERCRESVDLKTILDVAQSISFVFSDQDVLNLLFENKIRFLDMAWNFIVASNPRNKFRLRAASDESRTAYEKAAVNPALLHWTGKLKPWVCPDVPYGNEWWQVAMDTPFMGHIIARMMDSLGERRKYYLKRYGEKVSAWDPAPKTVKRDLT